MWNYVFKNTAKKQLSKLDKKLQERLLEKLIFFGKHEDPLVFAKKLSNPKIGSYRFRIGEYRVIFDIDAEGKFIIVAIIGHRRDIYK